MAITFVGGTSYKSSVGGATVSLTSLTGGSDTQPSADDVVVVQWACGSNANRGPSATGYTQIAQQFANDVVDTSHYVGIKVMGGTPDTSVGLTVSSNASNGCAIARITVWRGVDTTTPQDVAATLAQALNTALANPGSITPTTSGAKILAFAAAAHTAGAVDLASSDLSAVFTDNRDATHDLSVLAGEHDWTSGAFDPAALTFGGTDSTDYSWAAVTMALRPASTSVNGTISGTADVTGAAAGTVVVVGSASGTADVTGASAAQVIVDASASGAVDVAGEATGTVGDASADFAAAGAVDVTGLATAGVTVAAEIAGAVDVSGSATLTAVALVIQRGGDDAPPISWKKRFYDRQIADFEEALEEILVADDPQEAAIEATEAFEPLDDPAPGITESLRDIASGLAVLRMQSLRRNELRKEIADIRAELERVAAWRRKRRNNEAAILLMM